MMAEDIVLEALIIVVEKLKAESVEEKIYLTVVTDNFEEQGFGLSKARGGKTQCF